MFKHEGRLVQQMHEGTLVEAGGYHGDWMSRIIRNLGGHHEPQEELVFHHLVARCRPGTTIVEVGAFWAFYTNWYLGAVAGSTAVCLEPDANKMALVQRNLALNGRSPMLVFEDDTVIGRTLRDAGGFEEESVVDVVRFLRRRHGFRPRLFVDVGANIGTHLLRGLRDGMFPRGVGMEMDRDNFGLLAVNVHLADCQQRAKLFDVAVTDRSGQILMEVASGNRGDHRVRLETHADGAAYDEHHRDVRSVGATTLDALETDCETLFDDGTLLWIDTQGHEEHVLAGAERILARERRPFVVLEFWPYGVERSGGRERLFRFLRQCRTVHDIRSPGWERQPPVSAAALESLYDGILAGAGADGLTFTDLLCIP